MLLLCKVFKNSKCYVKEFKLKNVSLKILSSDFSKSMVAHMSDMHSPQECKYKKYSGWFICTAH